MKQLPPPKKNYSLFWRVPFFASEDELVCQTDRELDVAGRATDGELGFC